MLSTKQYMNRLPVPDGTNGDVPKVRTVQPAVRYGMKQPIVWRILGMLMVISLTILSALPSWLLNQQVVGRLIMTLFSLPRQGWLFLTAVASRKVNKETHDARNKACDGCDSLRILVPRNEKKPLRRYCGSCRCPKWPLAELSWKNRLSGWHCPLRKHPGPYPDDRVMALIEGDNKHENENNNLDTRSATVGTSAVEQVREKGCCRGRS